MGRRGGGAGQRDGLATGHEATTGQSGRVRRAPVGRGMGQQGCVLLASHQESGWSLPYGRGGVEREGGSCPPKGQLSINLVAWEARMGTPFRRRCRAVQRQRPGSGERPSAPAT